MPRTKKLYAGGSDITILIAAPGERHEDSTPEAFVTLDQLESTLKLLTLQAGSGFDYDYEFYLTVMTPNKPIADEGDVKVSIHFTLEGGFTIYNVDNNEDVSMEELITQLTDIHNRQTQLPTDQPKKQVQQLQQEILARRQKQEKQKKQAQQKKQKQERQLVEAAKQLPEEW
jgi:hypothetical protein